MEDPERILRDTADIANAAKDIEEQERAIVADEAEKDALRHRITELDADEAERRKHQLDDDRVIDERSRDLKEALGATGQPPHHPADPPVAPPVTPKGPAAPPVGGDGPIAGPGNPPVTPPRRVG